MFDLNRPVEWIETHYNEIELYIILIWSLNVLLVK